MAIHMVQQNIHLIRRSQRVDHDSVLVLKWIDNLSLNQKQPSARVPPIDFSRTARQAVNLKRAGRTGQTRNAT